MESHTAATEQRMMPKPKAQPLKDVVVCAAMGGKTEEQNNPFYREVTDRRSDAQAWLL